MVINVYRIARKSHTQCFARIIILNNLISLNTLFAPLCSLILLSGGKKYELEKNNYSTTCIQTRTVLPLQRYGVWNPPTWRATIHSDVQYLVLFSYAKHQYHIVRLYEVNFSILNLVEIDSLAVIGMHGL